MFRQLNKPLRLVLMLALLLAQSLTLLHAYEHLSDLDHSESSDCSVCLISHSLNDSNHVWVSSTDKPSVTSLHIKKEKSVYLKPGQNQLAIRAPPYSIAN